MTTQRRASSPPTTAEHRDEYPTEVFEPAWDDELADDQEPARPAGSAAPEDEPEEELEYPTQVLAAFSDEPEDYAGYPEDAHVDRAEDSADHQRYQDYPEYDYLDQDQPDRDSGADTAADHGADYPADNGGDYPADYAADYGSDYGSDYPADHGAHHHADHPADYPVDYTADYGETRDSAEWTEPEPAAPEEPKRTPSVAEQLFGTYDSESEDFEETALIARITDDGTIIEADREHRPVTAVPAPEPEQPKHPAPKPPADPSAPAPLPTRVPGAGWRAGWELSSGLFEAEKGGPGLFETSETAGSSRAATAGPAGSERAVEATNAGARNRSADASERPPAAARARTEVPAETAADNRTGAQEQAGPSEARDGRAGVESTGGALPRRQSPRSPAPARDDERIDPTAGEPTSVRTSSQAAAGPPAEQRAPAERRALSERRAPTESQPASAVREPELLSGYGQLEPAEETVGQDDSDRAVRGTDEPSADEPTEHAEPAGQRRTDAGQRNEPSERVDDDPDATSLMAAYSDADDPYAEEHTQLIPRSAAPPRTGGKGVKLLGIILLVVTLLAAAAAYLAWTKARAAERAMSAANAAFLDVAATAQVKDQVSKAIETIYSYDSAKLDQTEQQALSMITGSYAEEFKQNFTTVRQLAPKEKASLTSTVVEAGVESLTPTRATLLLMVNQVGRRADNPQPLRAAVRLGVTAQKVGGRWKVAEVSQK